MMGHREKLKDGTEVDCIYGKNIYLYVKHHSHNIKKRLSRRARRKINISTKAIPGHYEYDPMRDYFDFTEAR